jgi:hypothetical protein
MRIAILNARRTKINPEEVVMRILKKLENIFAAVAFAEAGEPETARELLKEKTGEGRKQTREPIYGTVEREEHIKQHPSRA